MKAFQQCMVDEKTELDEKIGNLQTFAAGKVFTSLPEQEQERMIAQFSHMQDYSRILGERIAAF